uniref:Uncharacterized protein n=1 Tax=Sciurus vulgaris TaxID=55149 RepID=A0A8D2CR44_SCIVU
MIGGIVTTRLSTRMEDQGGPDMPPTEKQGYSQPCPLCLLCTGSSSLATVPHPLKTYACSKFLSTRSLVSTSQLLSRPQTLTHESFSSLAVPCPLTSLIPSCSFYTSTISRDIDTAAKFIGAGAATVGGWLWGWDWDCVWKPYCWSCQEPSLTQQLFYAMLGFALSEARGLFCLMVAFVVLFTMRRSRLCLEFLLPYLACPVCPFSLTSPGSLGRVVGSGFDRGKANKYCIKKKKK